jgi:hypothetical protein
MSTYTTGTYRAASRPLAASILAELLPRTVVRRGVPDGPQGTARSSSRGDAPRDGREGAVREPRA